MEITVINYKNCDVVKVVGRVDSATAPKLSEALEALVNDGHFKIVVDLTDAEYMSSAGFRALLAAQKECKKFNRGEVALAVVPETIKSALDLTGMTTLFSTYDEVAAAVGNI
jgi:anti-sigma B factor antagonist